MTDPELLHWVEVILAQTVDVLGKRRHTSAAWLAVGEAANDLLKAKWELTKVAAVSPPSPG